MTALIWASNLGYDEIVDRLIDEKAALNTKDKEGDTALHHAATNGRVGAVKKLLQANCAHDD